MKWAIPLFLAICGCGSASVEIIHEDNADDWQETSGAEIPPPVSRGWPLRGGDPESDEQRVACIQQIDVSRAHMSRAIDSAMALGAYDRLRCLSDKAAFMKELRMELIGASLSEGGVDVRGTCLRAQTLVYETRRDCN